MNDLERYTAYRCPECGRSAPGMLWGEGEVYCEDCGSHPSAVCHYCDQHSDTVFVEARSLLDASAVGEAIRFAAAAHGSIDQRRKYSNEPYIVHPLEVAEIVRSVPHTESMLIAAVLHDVVEDTPVKATHVAIEFGQEVADLVEWLTDVSQLGDGSREQRKAIDRAHIAKAPPAAKTIKLADLIDNTKTIKSRDPDFWKIYRREKLLLLEVLVEGDSTLWARAMAQCEE